MMEWPSWWYWVRKGSTNETFPAGGGPISFVPRGGPFVLLARARGTRPGILRALMFESTTACSRTSSWHPPNFREVPEPCEFAFERSP